MEAPPPRPPGVIPGSADEVATSRHDGGDVRVEEVNLSPETARKEGMKTPYRPSILVLSSGGVKGLGMIGALSVLHAEGTLSAVHTYVGSSVGAVIALMIVAGCTLQEIFEVALRSSVLVPWRDMHKLDTVFFREYGFCPKEKVTEAITTLVSSKLGGIPTLKELYERTGKRLVMVTGNSSEGTAVYNDYLSEPDMPCVSAMVASMLIVGVISKFEWRGKMMVDGAFVDPYPVKYLDDGESVILGVAVVGVGGRIDSFASHVIAAMTLSFERLQRLAMAAASDKVTTLELTLPDISIMDRARDVNARFQCYNAGVLQGMRLVARLHASSYEAWYGVSALPEEYTPVACHEVRKSSVEHAIPRAPGRFELALGRIPVPRIRRDGL
jgi:predicted acylesterase/phospholipase RssA